MGIWVVSTFDLLWVILPWTFMYKFLWGHISSFLLGIFIPRSGIAGQYANTMLNHLRNWDTFPKHLHHVTFPSAVCEGYNLSPSSLSLVVICLFDHRSPFESALVRDFSPAFCGAGRREGTASQQGERWPWKGTVVSGGGGPRAALPSSVWTCLTCELQGPAKPKWQASLPVPTAPYGQGHR